MSAEKSSSDDDDIITADSHFWRRRFVSGTVPIPRHAFSSAVYKDKFYIIGGYGQGGVYLDDTWVLDLKSSVWSWFHTRPHATQPVGWTLPPMHSAGHTLVGSVLYIFGGITQHGRHLGTLMSLDLETGFWRSSQIAPHPSPRWGTSLVTHGENIYCFGGYGETFFSDLWVFDTKAQTWTELTPAGVPPPRHFHTAIAFEDKMHIIGGFRGSVFTADIWSYSFTANRWVRDAGTSALSSRRGHSAVVIPSRRSVLVFGGRDAKTRLGDILEYNIDDQTVRELRNAGASPTSRVFHGAFLYNNSMWSFGGLEIFNINELIEYVLEPDPPAKGTIIDFSRLFKNEMLADVTFSINGSRIPAHKAILCAASDHFMRMFASGMKESNQEVVELSDVSNQAFESLLEFLYTGNVRLSRSNIFEILTLADKFLITELIERIETALGFILSPETMQKILASVISIPSAHKTYQACVSMLKNNIQHESYAKMKKLIRKVDSNLASELSELRSSSPKSTASRSPSSSSSTQTS